MTAEVEGILKFNNDIRDEMLARNLGKYSQIDFKLEPAIGEYYEIDDYRPLKDAKDGKDMLSFTHDGKSDYSKEIKRKYFSFGEEEPYYVRQLTYSELNPWISFQQGNYIKYIDEVFGKDEVMRHVDYVNNILSGRFIENALRQTEVGVIEDINVPVALQGIVTINPNNMSGEDTVLGKISNRMYAQTLYNGAMFNSTRMRAEIRDGENYYNKAYITPYLVNKYGNNMATVMQLSDIMKLNANETHIREDLGADVHILDGYGDNSFADLSNPEFRLLNEQIQNAIISNGFSRDKFGDKLIIINDDGLLPRQMYTLEEHYGYVDDVKDDHAFRFNSFSQRNEDNTFSASENNGSSGRISGKYNMLVYNEGGSNYSGNPDMLERLDDNVDEFNTFDSFSVINDETTGAYDLMNKTNILFRENELDTLIGRFHTSKDEYKYPEFTDTARSAFGNSHGRNLLVLDALEEKPTTNGYSNPYCRTWTFHHQYNQVKKLIRPFTLRVGDRERPYTLKEVQSMNKKYRAFRNDSGKENAIIGYERLADNTVLQNNGFVRITPKSGDEKSKIKNCMFSIENLAWKDVLKHEDNLSVEQTGPNGGRIMWFPPYDLDFQESVNVDWNQNTFIGRGEKVYTYTNTDRTGTLSFSLLIDHPAIINSVTKDSYEGMGKEKDPEADILRFFAGCELLPETEKIKGKIEKEKEKPEPKPKKGHIKFKIYFPNNFTGLITNRLKLEGRLYDEFNNYVVTDNASGSTSGSTSGGTTGSTYDEKYAKDYWWQYLLVGNNTCVPDERKDFRGYEMLPVPEDKKDAKETDKNCGLSNNETKYTNKPLPTCQKNQKIEGVIDKVRTIDGYRISCTVDKLDRTRQYHYFVDEDLHQQIDVTSYRDPNSFRLNATFDNAIKHKVTRRADEFTFAEVILALLEVNEADEVYGPLYRKYKDYILDDIFPTSDSIGYSPYANYSDLVRIFSNKDLKFKKVTYRGSADKNDSPNAKMLAFRRGTVGSELIKRLLHTELEMKNAGLIVGGKSGVAAYLEEQKQNRYCYFDIEYEIPSEEFKDGAGNRNGNGSNSGDDNPSGTTVTFKEYWDAITANSEIIKQYYTNINGTDEGALQKQLESHFNSLKNVDITSQEFINEQINVLLDKYINEDALILAYAMCYVGTTGQYLNSEFRNAYYATLPGCEPDDENYCEDYKRGYWNMKDYKGGSLITMDSQNDYHYLRTMICHFAAVGAKVEDYEPEGVVGENVFEYTKFPLKPYTHSFSMSKLIPEFTFVHDIRDRISEINPMIKGDKEHLEYITRLLKTCWGTYKVKINAMKATYYRNSKDDISQPNPEVKNFYLELNNEIDGQCIPKMNSEIKATEDAEKKAEAEARAQRIEQIRKQSEADKKAKEDAAFNKEYVYAYGPDLDKVPNNRYETEGEYFKNIDIKDPVLYKNLKDKFKYFNPAYHSISPEGFNARLTFLHQCTRQGQTVEAKIKNGNRYTGTASNLAFGRMPVCVIRIGDFINTRAIINSMSITYAASNGMVWDLNPEGAGVQPMYAKISLQITLLGGQSLEAPISRLQNAISFNYYANAEAYDNRADVAIYKPAEKEGGNGYVEYRRIWSPLSKEYEYKNGQLVETGRLVNNETDDFNKRHANDGTWHDLTDEQIDDVFNGDGNSGSTSGDTSADDLVYSSDMSNYVSSYSEVVDIVTGFIKTIKINVYCNKGYLDSGYKKSEYKKDNATYGNLEFMPGVTNQEYILGELEKAMRHGIDKFVNTH